MKEFIRKYKFTIISILLVLTAILMPGDDVPSVGIPNIDKVVHCGMFGFVTMCYYWEYYRAEKKAPIFIWSFLCLVAFGGMTELMQNFVPGRSCDYKDLIADSTGILIMIGLARGLIKYKYKANDKNEAQ